jgi:hypothetical protein
MRYQTAPCPDAEASYEGLLGAVNLAKSIPGGAVHSVKTVLFEQQWQSGDRQV